MLDLKNIKKNYRMGVIDVEVLRGIDLSFESGETVSIVGPSGSGKSTLMNIIGCLDVPTEGTYFLDGHNVADMNENQLADIRNSKVGFVFQTFNLLSRQTALSNVLLPLMYSKGKDRKPRSEAALQRVGLGDRINHKPTQLSGGQQQRVAIARALVNNPNILLADEPTGNLDSTATNEIMSIFRDLNENEGITVIMVTHEEEIAAQAKRIISMKDGLITSDIKTSVN